MANYPDPDYFPGCPCNKCEGFGPKKVEVVIPSTYTPWRISMDDRSLTPGFKKFMKQLYQLIDEGSVA